MLFILLMIATTALGQETVDDYMHYWLDQQRQESEHIQSDTLLFYRVAQNSHDLFGELTSYAFSFVGYSRRGVDYRERKHTIDGIEIRSANLPIVRHLGLSSRSYGDLSHGYQQIGGMGGGEEFSAVESVPLDGAKASIFFSGKGYLGGARASIDAFMLRGWSLSAYLAATGGNDLYVDGVYRDIADAGIRLTKDFASEATLSILCAITAGERGLRSGSTEEAFSLTGNNLYNPLWGDQQGKVRNSRIRRQAVPFAMMTLATPISHNTRLTLSMGGDYGLRKLSSLSWFDASTPRPDNYRYMPSYFGDPIISEAVANEWRYGNEKYTQIDWAELYRINSLSTDDAVYAVDDRVERIARGEVALRLHSEPGRNFSLSYGIRANWHSTRHYKQMRDMLSAEYLVDLDYYLLDDDSYSNRLQNDLQNPNRRITEGDRYSYDYALEQYEVEADIQAEYRHNKWRIDADLAIGSVTIWRTGYYEKEIFSGERSLGRSAISHFTPYTAKLSTVYLFSMNHRLGINALAAARAPYTANLFFNPEYNNRLVYTHSEERSFAAEVTYKYSNQKIEFSLAAYINSTHDGRRTFRVYDDLSGVYCDVDVNEISTLRYGVEAAMEIQLSRLFKASAALSAGRYRYLHNPSITHYADTDNHIVSSNSESFVSNCTIGGTPQIVAMASLTYLNYRGWAASLDVQGVALRYADLSFTRRTERIAHQSATSAEIYDMFMQQSRLNDAVTVDLSLSRWFRVGPGRMSITLSVKNLLGSRNIVYDAYEPSRIRNYYSGEQRIFMPQDDVLTYAYPRTLYAVISWKF